MIPFNIAITLVTPLLFGFIPALIASRPESLGDRSKSKPRSSGLVRDILVSAEVALSVVLLVGAGLLLRSFLRLESADLGFRTEHTVTFRLVSTGREGGLIGGERTFTDIENRLRALPGVQAVGGSWSLPLRQLQDPSLVATIEGRVGDCEILRGGVTHDYFRTLLTPMLADAEATEVYFAHHHDKVVISVPDPMARQQLLKVLTENHELYKDISGFEGLPARDD